MRLICGVLLILVCSCQSQERPKEVLNREQLAALLVDVYLAETRTETIPKARDSTIQYFIPFEKELLKKHGISDSVMQITHSFYIQHPKELELVYDAVIDTLSLRERTVNLITNKVSIEKSKKSIKEVRDDKFKNLKDQKKNTLPAKKPIKKLEPK